MTSDLDRSETDVRPLAAVAVVALAGRVVGVLALFGVALVSARFLGPSERGAFFSITVYVGLTGTALDGLIVAVVYQAGHGHGWPAGSVRAASLALGAVLTLVAIAMAIVTSGATRDVGLFVALAALPMAGQRTLAGAFLRDRSLLLCSVALYGYAAVAVAGMLIVFAVAPELRTATTAAAILVSSIAAATLGLAIGTQLRFGRPGAGFLSLSSIGSVLGFVVVGGLSSFAAVAANRIDVIVLDLMRTSRDVGIYSIAVQLGDVLLFFAVAASAAVTPELGRRRPAEGLELTARTLRVALLVIIPSCVVFALLADQLVTIPFGRDFAGAADPLRLLTIAVPFVGASGIMSVYFIQVRGRPAVPLIAAGASVGLGALLSVLLLPSQGLAGLAIAKILASMFGFLVLLGFLYWHVGREAFAVVAFRFDDLRACARLPFAFLGSRR